METAFLVKYGEIGIKGNNKKSFENKLINTIVTSLNTDDLSAKVSYEDGRIYVKIKNPDHGTRVLEKLEKIFGIVGICPMLQLQDEGFERLAEEIIQYIKNTYEEKNFTFKVKAMRARKNYPFTSMQINEELGGKLLEAFPNLKVDVHNPDVVVHVEIRSRINVYTKVVKGQGGMPQGTSGKGLLLLSGGIDSPVAGYMMAKRGVKLEALYFHAPPYTSDRAKQKVCDLASILSEYSGGVRLHIVNFTQIQRYIYEKCPHDELTIIMRRYMMKIAQEVAAKIEANALITGESLAQVASQTMQSLNVTDKVCDMTVFRPLIGMDKVDIIKIAQKIGTFDTSILPYEDCCTIFVAKHPVTKPKLNRIEHSEMYLSEHIEEYMRAAVEETEVVDL